MHFVIYYMLPQQLRWLDKILTCSRSLLYTMLMFPVVTFSERISVVVT